METALAAAAPGTLNLAPSAAGGEGFTQRLAALPTPRKWLLGAGLAALLGIAVLLATAGRAADYKVLYANLSDKDGGAILAQLSQMNVPYKHADGGAAILVPAEQVHDVRLKLASAGLPKGSTAGFELMDNAKFGQTQFQERLTFQRGLEGELTRSIGALAAVQSARVHLALPNQNGFFREQQKPSASVLLTLHAGRSLDRAQIAGIVHLVSSSVPEMNPKAVSVLDQSGALLSGPQEALGGSAGLDAQQLQYVQQIERSYAQRISDLLEPVVGRDNLRANVTAEVDFSETEATSEEFRPNQGASATPTVRSLQTSELGAGGAGGLPTGVPGAASNQPPTPASAPINGPAQALAAATAGGSVGPGGRRDSTVNFEVDRTVRVTRAASGGVRRINAAVVVNHRSTTDAKGKTSSSPLPEEELQKLEALVKESIGFNAERGDSVKIVNAPFRVTAPEPVPELPLWQQPEVQDLVRTLALPAALTVLALIVVFGAIRPALQAARPAERAAGPRLDTVVDDLNVLPGAEGAAPGLPGPGGVPALAAGALPALEAPATDLRLDRARLLAKENPAAVATIMRQWVSKDA